MPVGRKVVGNFPQAKMKRTREQESRGRARVPKGSFMKKQNCWWPPPRLMNQTNDFWDCPKTCAGPGKFILKGPYVKSSIFMHIHTNIYIYTHTIYL